MVGLDEKAIIRFMKISRALLHDQITAILSKNMSSEYASIVADYFVWAEASGNKTQGIIKMTGTEPIQDIVPKYDLRIERDTKLSQLIDAGANPAPPVTRIGSDVAIAKAKEHGFGLVGIRNTFSSNGAQAYYARMIAENDLIGIVCSRSPAAMSGFGSIDAIFGTNPIGFGFPTGDDPLVFDTATSAMTFYGLVLAKARGESIPEGIATDHDGNFTTDPSEAMEGAILPFDKSYKGAGFGMMIELLAGPLVGGAWIDNKTFKEEWGTLILAIDPGLLIDTNDFKSNVDDMINKIKSSRTRDGETIRLPGEQASVLYKNAVANDEIEIDDTIAGQIGIEQAV